MSSSWGTGRSGKHTEGQVRKVSAPKPEWQVTVKVTTSLGVDYTYNPVEPSLYMKPLRRWRSGVI